MRVVDGLQPGQQWLGAEVAEGVAALEHGHDGRGGVQAGHGDGGLGEVGGRTALGR